MAGESLAAALDEGQLERMLALLEAEHRLYSDLCALARRKQEILIRGQLDELERLLGEEKAALADVSRLEEERYALQCELAGQLGLQPAELTVSRLAELAGPFYGPRLSQVQQALVGLIDDLSTLSLCNAELIEQSLAYLNYALDLLSGGRAGEYDRQGGRRPGAARLNLLNRRA